MGGNGSIDVWRFGGDYYASIDGTDYSDDLPDEDSLRDMDGPYADINMIFAHNALGVLSVGPSTDMVSSRVHSLNELVKLLIVERDLIHAEDSNWFVRINGVRHEINAKALTIRKSA
jgi:hypothetical protein